MLLRICANMFDVMICDVCAPCFQGFVFHPETRQAVSGCCVFVVLPWKTNSSPLNNARWKAIFSLWNGPFSGDVKFWGVLFIDVVPHNFSMERYTYYPMISRFDASFGLDTRSILPPQDASSLVEVGLPMLRSWKADLKLYGCFQK